MYDRYSDREKFGRDVIRDNQKAKERAANQRLRQARDVRDLYEEDDFADEDDYRGYGNSEY